MRPAPGNTSKFEITGVLLLVAREVDGKGPEPDGSVKRRFKLQFVDLLYVHKVQTEKLRAEMVTGANKCIMNQYIAPLVLGHRPRLPEYPYWENDQLVPCIKQYVIADERQETLPSLSLGSSDRDDGTSECMR